MSIAFLLSSSDPSPSRPPAQGSRGKAIAPDDEDEDDDDDEQHE